MVKSKSNTRLFSITSTILTQTDTTVGFISQNAEKLYEIKSRSSNKPFIKVYSNFKELSKNNHRIPSQQKNLVRRSLKTTFIVKNQAFRISASSLNSQILRDMTWNYSTSANQSGKKFSLEFCEDKADIIVKDKNGLTENNASFLLKINNNKILRIRWANLFKHF